MLALRPAMQRPGTSSRSPSRLLPTCLLVVPVLMSTPTVSAQPATAAQAVGIATRIDALVQEVSHLRGLSVLRPVNRGVLDRPAILARLHARVAADYPPGEVALEGEMMRRLGLIPESMDYEQTVFDLLEEQVAGFYDPDEHRLFIASWVPDAMQTVTMSHEIVHALQDQHFNIARFTHHVRGHGDAQAAAAVTCSKAMPRMTMFDFMLRPLNQRVQTLQDPDQLFRAQLADLSGQPRMAAASGNSRIAHVPVPSRILDVPSRTSTARLPRHRRAFARATGVHRTGAPSREARRP